MFRPNVLRIVYSDAHAHEFLRFFAIKTPMTTTLAVKATIIGRRIDVNSLLLND